MTPAPPRPSEPGAIFLFPGQGSRPQGALTALYDPAAQVPARALDAADEVLAEVDGVAAEHGYGPVSDVLRNAGQEEHLPYGVGPLACFAASVALAHALEASGVVPRLLFGYSLGEFAALVYAEAFTVPEGAGLVCSLNTAYAPETGRGGCLLVDASEDGTRDLLRRTGSREVVVACVNAPEQTVVSGPRDTIEALLALDSPPHPRLHRLPIPYAAHHPCLQGVADTFLRLSETTTQRPLRRPTVSTVRRRLCTTTTLSWQGSPRASPSPPTSWRPFSGFRPARARACSWRRAWVTLSPGRSPRHGRRHTYGHRSRRTARAPAPGTCSAWRDVCRRRGTPATGGW